MIKGLIFKKLMGLPLCFLITSSLFAQKHFKVIVNLPNGINKEKVDFLLEDKKGVEKIKPHSTSMNQVMLTGDYYSLYAAIKLQYPQEGKIKGFVNTFFVQQKPAVISFNQPDSLNSPFMNYSLENVEDFYEQKKEKEDYCAGERKKALDYQIKYEDIIFNGGDTTIRNYYFKGLMKNLVRKELEYIMINLDSYYSFYSFRSDVVSRGVLSPDTLLLAFNNFPDKFRYTDEGNYLHEFIIGRQSFKNREVDFQTKDINSKKIELSQFKGKNYVLLHFWATWCTPCMRELPALKQISKNYKSKGLKIISIALKSPNYANYLSTLRKYQMDWINIYNDLEFINKYGNMPTPRFCIIDKSGKIIYDNIGLGKNENFQLDELNKTLKEIIN